MNRLYIQFLSIWFVLLIQVEACLAFQPFFLNYPKKRTTLNHKLKLQFQNTRVHEKVNLPHLLYSNETRELKNLSNSKLKKNLGLIQLFIKFLSNHVRRILWPGLSKNFDSSIEAPLPPLAPLGCPFFGNNVLAGSQKKGPEYFYSEASAMMKPNHPRIWRFYFMGNSIISISGSKNVNAVLQSNKFSIVSYSDTSSANQEAKTGKKKKELFSSNSVMFEVDKEKHQFLRHLIGAAFTTKSVLASMNNISNAARQQLSRIHVGESVKMEEICESFSLDIAWRAILGLDLEDDEEEIRRFHRAVNRYVSGVFSIFTYLNLPGKTLTPAYKARKYLVSKIEERIQFLRHNGPDGSTLSAMVFSTEEGSQKKLSQGDIVENALILLVAGTETTASTLTSAIFFLGLHPFIWEKLISEQEELVSKHGPQFTKEFLDDCVYLDAVIKETLRIVPISGGNLRRAEETILLDGKQVPKGSSVFCNIRLTHELDPLIASSTSMDPMINFKPERWLDFETSPREDFMPFGTGSRRCLGAPLAMAEMRVFLSLFARKIASFELLGVGRISRKSGRSMIRWKPTSIIPKPFDGVPISATTHQVQT